MVKGNMYAGRRLEVRLSSRASHSDRCDSMNYQVLARKWRPRDFASLVGQEHVVRALRNALTQQRLHHDEERARAVAARVKEWKAKRAMYLPNFPKDKIAEVKGSLDYPPEGSPQHTGTSA